MVVVLSRFRVANAMEGDVARAFMQRPREVEDVSGFLWLEVFVDRSDPSIFYLLTRWADLPSFERWHSSPAHRSSHALIPKGLKLDASWTQVLTLDRLDGTTGPVITDALADSTLLVSTVATRSTAMYVFVLTHEGVIRTCNPVACEHLHEGAALDGKSLLSYMPAADAAVLRERLAHPGRTTQPLRLNFGAMLRVPFTLDCWLDVRPADAVLIGHPTFQRDQQLQDQLMSINQELAVLSRERARETRDERFAREAAEKLNRERNAFLTVIAHELRQPISAALAAMSVLRKTLTDPRLDRPRGVLERQLQQMTRLVEDLADTAKVASGTVELRKTDVDLAQQLRQLATSWEETAKGQYKTFTTRVPDTRLVVVGDIDRLQQVFSNLVSNALKYTPEGGSVTVTLEREGGSAVVLVQDEGEGIPADRLPHIFELFQRATTTGTGLGVGLAVVYALVKAHGGSIEAASGGVGQGATFTVRLPLDASEYGNP